MSNVNISLSIIRNVMNNTIIQKVTKNLDIIVIILFAALLRFPGILHGLPTYVMPSESEIISIAVKNFKGNLYHEWIFYGGLYFYVNAVLIGLVHAVYH